MLSTGAVDGGENKRKVDRQFSEARTAEVVRPSAIFPSDGYSGVLGWQPCAQVSP